jgi:hypothetical protein
MIRYRNTGGNSGVSAYELSTQGIKVMFNNGGVYLYTNTSAGSHNIATMKSLATSGSGLNSFIGRVVKMKYAVKLA